MYRSFTDSGSAREVIKVALGLNKDRIQPEDVGFLIQAGESEVTAGNAAALACLRPDLFGSDHDGNPDFVVAGLGPEYLSAAIEEYRSFMETPGAREWTCWEIVSMAAACLGLDVFEQ